MFLILIKAKKWFDEIKRIDKKIDYTKFVCVDSNERILNFNHFRRLRDFIRSIYSGEISLEQAIERQNEMEDLLRSLSGYKTKQKQQQQQKHSKKGVLENANCFLMEEGRLLMYLNKISFHYLYNPNIEDMRSMLLILH